MKNAHLFPTHPSSFILAIFIRSVFFCLLIGKANSQILVNNGNGIGEYSAYGIPINAALVNGLSNPQGIAISGSNLFVVDNGTATIGEYTLSGSVVTNRLIFGLSVPEGIAISGTNIFVANWGTRTVGEYTLSGAIVNATLIGTNSIYSPVPLCTAISGTNLFISFYDGPVYKCTTSGAVLNSNFPSSGSILAASANIVFEASSSNKILEYNTSGVLLSSNRIQVSTNLGTINGIAVSGNNLYILTTKSKTNTAVVGQYTISGATNNPSLFTVEYTNGSTPFGIAVMPQSFSSSPTALAANISSTNLNLSWSTNGSEYLLECSPLLGLANWTTITNQPVVTNGNYLITLPTPNQSQFFRLHSIDN